MDANYRIRQAVAADIEGVAVLERGMENAPHWTMADYLAALSPPYSAPGIAGTKRCFFVAHAASVLVGFSVGKIAVLDAVVLAELESVGVADWARRAGVGRALCKAVIWWAHAQGAWEIELEVRSMSKGAIALYRGMGFVETGRRRDYYRGPADDAVLMRCSTSLERA